MTLILVLAVALAVGMSVQSRWVLLLPLSVGVVGAVAIALAGGELRDTPLPFLMVTATLAMGAGLVMRSRLSAR